MKKIAIFNEGNSYYSTFILLVKGFIENKFQITYYSLDKEDKILNIESGYLKKIIIKKNFFGYLKFYQIDADVLISTTPNIGCKGYPLMKPRKVKNLVHVFHSISDISIYRKGSLDNYDSVILAGEFQKKSIRYLEKLRGLKIKKLYNLGVPYIDYLINEKRNLKQVKNKNFNVLVASSWGKKGCLMTYGTNFIKELSLKYDVTVRPHPYSYITEKSFIQKCVKELSDTNVNWSKDIDPLNDLNKADILISDTSSIRFDYKVLYNKPLITLSIDSIEMDDYERNYLNHDWISDSDKLIGPVLNKTSIMNLNNIVEKAKSKKNNKSLRKNIIYNQGLASRKIVEFFIKN